MDLQYLHSMMGSWTQIVREQMDSGVGDVDFEGVLAVTERAEELIETVATLANLLGNEIPAGAGQESLPIDEASTEDEGLPNKDIHGKEGH